MKKRIFTVFLTILLFMLSTVGVWASEGSDDSGFSGEYERLTDSAGLLSEEEAQNILTKLDEVSERQKFDIVILTVDSLEGATATEYADDFFDYYGYGYGEGKDGILFLVSMEDRDWALSTHGYGITAFTDAGCDYIAEQFKSSLSDGEYEKAFEIYIDQCDAFVTQAREDRPYDNSNLPKKTTWNDMDSGCTGAWIYLCIFNCRRNETTIENRGKKNNGRKLSEKRQSKSDRKQ